MESETLDREKEAKVNVAAYADAPSTPAAVAAPAPMAAAPFMAYDEPAPKKSRMGLLAAAAAVVVLLGGGAAWMMLKPKAATTTASAAPAPKPAPVKAQIAAPAVISSTPLTSSAPATGTMDAAAQKKAFEQAVEQKLQEEMMKLQSDYTKSLKQQQSKNAPVQTAAAQTPAPVDDSQSAAAQLDARRLAASQQPAPVPQTVTQQAAPAVTPSQPVLQPQPAAPAPVASAVKEGDVVDFTELDTVPQPLGSIKADYPRLAMQQRAKGQVIVSALISESGEVLDVKILKGDTRFGFNDAALRAMRGARFSAPVKDGKHVRTWRPQTFVFSL